MKRENLTGVEGEAQPTGDEFNEILAAAYAALMQMPVKPETYETFVRSEMADHLDVPQPQD